MDATYRALCKHGYAELTMQDIADESEKSKATLHYHYDTKQELLLAFLDHLFEKFFEKIDTKKTDNPAVALVEILTPEEKGDKYPEFKTAILEIKAQSPYNNEFREKLTEHENAFKSHLMDIIERGIKQDIFKEEVDPSETAEFLITLINGLHTRSVAVGKTNDEVEKMVKEYIRTNLLSNNYTEPDII